jgi:hypothetical protein
MHSASPPGLKRPKAHPTGFQRSRASARAVTLEPPRHRAALLSNRAACADQPPRPHVSMTLSFRCSSRRNTPWLFSPTSYRYPEDRVPLYISLKSRQVVVCASTHCHVTYGSGPRFLAEVGSGAVTCPMSLDLASRLRWAPVLPCALWLRTSPPSWGGLQRCHVSYGSRPCLPAEVGSGAAKCHMAHDLTSRLRWASSIKKSLAVLPVQLGTHVPNA